MIYFNEFDEVACAVLRECYGGHVDGRSIADVLPADLGPFRRAHFFAGAGLWEIACRLAEWPPEVPLWTASCPCQPFSGACKGAGVDDARHLWPDLFRLVSACRPPCVVGEQVAGKAGDAWLDGVGSDLESIGYAFRAVEVPACAVDAPHKRARNWWLAMADADSCGRDGRPQDAQRGALGRNAAEWADGPMGNGDGSGLQGDSPSSALGETRRGLAWRTAKRADGSFWADSEWLNCADGKARRAPIPESYFRNVADGLSGDLSNFDPARLLVPSFKGRASAWRLAGNAIVHQVAAVVLASILETM